LDHTLGRRQFPKGQEANRASDEITELRVQKLGLRSAKASQELNSHDPGKKKEAQKSDLGTISF
jgi:hypothetical protein